MVELTIKHFLIVCPLVFLASFIDAIAGGGGLISLPAYMLAGLSPNQAKASNKLSAVMGATTSFYKYGKNGFIPWKIAIICTITSLIGSTIGSKITLLIDDTVFKYIMLVVLPITAFIVLKGKAIDKDREPLSKKKTIILAMIITGVIGAYDGFYGPGTGTFMILLLSSVAHIKLDEANGISKAANFGSNFAANIVYLASGNTVIPLSLCAGAFSIAGAYVGSHLYGKKGRKIAKPIVLIVIAIFLGKLIYELFL